MVNFILGKPVDFKTSMSLKPEIYVLLFNLVCLWLQPKAISIERYDQMFRSDPVTA